jgi:hypothetical protein
MATCVVVGKKEIIKNIDLDFLFTFLHPLSIKE